MTTTLFYQNKKNPNKYIEVHNDGHRHNTVRQFIYHDFTGVLNYTGAKKGSYKSTLYRWRKANLNELLTDYTLVWEG